MLWIIPEFPSQQGAPQRCPLPQPCSQRSTAPLPAREVVPCAHLMVRCRTWCMADTVFSQATCREESTLSPRPQAAWVGLPTDTALGTTIPRSPRHGAVAAKIPGELSREACALNGPQAALSILPGM